MAWPCCARHPSSMVAEDAQEVAVAAGHADRPAAPTKRVGMRPAEDASGEWFGRWPARLRTDPCGGRAAANSAVDWCASWCTI